jgi:eukaryotic translation initiation factor 2C
LRGIEAVERRLTQLKPSPFAVRPGHGVAGKALTVKTNYFQVRPWNGETPKIIQYVSCREYKKPWEAADFSHYDVEIDPHVRVVNQKKPKALLRAVWEQLVLDQKNDPWVGPFSASAFDGRKNAYTPIEFPMGRGTSIQLMDSWTTSWFIENSQTFTVAVNTDGVVQKPGQSSGSEDEQRKWKIVIKHVALIDLEAVIKFCKADNGSAKVEEACLTGKLPFQVDCRMVQLTASSHGGKCPSSRCPF